MWPREMLVPTHRLSLMWLLPQHHHQHLNLHPHKCKPIATKPRRFSLDDRQFIQSEVYHLMLDGVIEFSTSPWCAQVVVVKSAVPSNEKDFV